MELPRPVFRASRPTVPFLSVAHLQKRYSSMNSSEFDRRFDVGDAVLSALDGEATPLGVTRQSFIIVWLAG